MRITVLGKGNVGGGLADVWERAEHQVTRLGRDGGDVSDAEVVVVAVPGDSIAEALDRLDRRRRQDGDRRDQPDWCRRAGPIRFNAEFVKSRMGGRLRNRSTSTSLR